MTRELFLKDLNNALAGLGGEEVESILAYYSEMIDDRMEAGMTEEDAVNAMEPVDTIASRVLSEAEGEDQAEEIPEEKAPEKNDPEKEIRRSAEEVTEFVITADNQRVHLTTGDTEEIVLRYRINDGDIYQLHEENGVMTLEHTHRPVSSYKIDPKKLTVDNFIDEIGKFIGSINLNNLIQVGGIIGETRCIEVLLPRIYKGKVTVRTSNSRIMAEEVTCLGEMKLCTSNARVALSHIVAHQLNIGTSNGRIVLEDVYVRNHLDAVTSNSRIVADKVVSDNDMHLRTSNSTVSVESVDAKALVIKTSNASVTGTIKGAAEDFAIQSGTSNGKNNLIDRLEGEKQLTVRTSNGNISLEFIG